MTRRRAVPTSERLGVGDLHVQGLGSALRHCGRRGTTLKESLWVRARRHLARRMEWAVAVVGPRSLSGGFIGGARGVGRDCAVPKGAPGWGWVRPDEFRPRRRPGRGRRGLATITIRRRQAASAWWAWRSWLGRALRESVLRGLDWRLTMVYFVRERAAINR